MKLPAAKGDWRPSNGGRKVVGKFPSAKADDMVWWESQIERDFLFLAEFDPDVLRIRRYVPDEAIRYKIGPKSHRYTSDYWIQRAGGWQVVEVKPEKQAQKEHYVVLFRAVRPIYRELGYEFRVALDTEIRRQPRLSNVKLLQRYAHARVSENEQIACAEFFKGVDEAPLGEVVSALKPKRVSPQSVYALLRYGFLDTDLFTRTITKESPVWLAGGFDPSLTGRI